MNSTGPLIRSRELWAGRETKCLTIIARALQLLREDGVLPSAEVDLNRRFYFCLLAATRELYPNDEIAPIAECNNQPDPDDESRARREQKRPDFQWVYLDRYQPDPLRSSRQFVVEGKRLGISPRPDWILNLNYINNGVDRFRDPQWAYGKRAGSGAMIGYCQSMAPGEILSDINAECGRRSFPNLRLVGEWGIGATSRLEHAFVRTFEMSPFTLHHFWVDLR